jgi:hypothetical protein
MSLINILLIIFSPDKTVLGNQRGYFMIALLCNAFIILMSVLVHKYAFVSKVEEFQYNDAKQMYCINLKSLRAVQIYSTFWAFLMGIGTFATIMVLKPLGSKQRDRIKEYIRVRNAS